MSKKARKLKAARAAAAAQRPPWLTVRNEGDAVEMVIAGTIGSSWWDDSGTTSREFREKFGIVPRGSTVHVRINSEGGSVSDALEIYNIIRRAVKDGQKVVTFNDGYALSSASLILCAGSTVVAPASSIEMIHEPWSMTVGDETDHLRAAEMLSKHGDTIAQIYARRTGASAAEMRQLMRDETWFTGAEAMDEGLTDQLSMDAACPNCGHEQDANDETEAGNITCSDCGEVHAATEWEETEEEELVEDRFAALDLSRFKNVPQNVLELISDVKAGRRPSKSISTPAMASPAPTSNPVTPIMKKKIIALLKKHGVTVPDNATDEWLEAELAKIENLAPAPVNTVSLVEFQRVQAQLETEKRTRVRARVIQAGENRVANDDIDFWVESAMKDEDNTIARIGRMHEQRPGGEPIGGSVSIADSRMEAIKKEPVAAKRYGMLKNEWNGLYADAVVRDTRQRLSPVNANSYSATLVTQFLVDGAVTKLQNRWAALKAFSRDYSPDRYKPRASGQLKYVTASGTTQKNATNFETSGDATVTPVQIDVDQYTTGMHVTNDELNSGFRMENLLEIKISECADNILKVAFSPLSTGNFTTNAKITQPSAAFSFSDMADASGRLKKSSIKHAVLDGEYIARIENSPVFFQATGTMNGGADGWKRFGWDGVHLNSNWSGTHAGANDQSIRGLFCNPQALGAIAGLPLTLPANIPGGILQEGSFTVPDVDISVATYLWFATASRTYWMTYDLMFGSSLLDESAGVLLTSA